MSTDPSFLPSIIAWRFTSYFYVAAGAGMIYDWVLTLGQEIELVWGQRWSLMTVLYLSTRYLGIFFTVLQILVDVPTISLTDAGCQIIWITGSLVGVVVNAILDVIVLTRLCAMYQRSRKVMIPLVIVLLVVLVAVGVLGVMETRSISGEGLILSGTYECNIVIGGDGLLLGTIIWVLGTAWEVFALCLAAWIAVKHFRELRQQSSGGIFGNVFTVLMRTHIAYFASFVGVSCFAMGGQLSATISTDTYSMKTQIYYGCLQIFQVVQMFVLGPRLILGIREYHADLVADSDAATGMTSIAFQERVHVSTSSTL